MVILTVEFKEFIWSGPDMHFERKKAFIFSSEMAATKYYNSIPSDAKAAISKVQIFTEVHDRLEV